MQAHGYSQQTCAPMFLRLALTASEHYTPSGMLLCEVPTRNNAPIPSGTRNRNSTWVAVMVIGGMNKPGNEENDLDFYKKYWQNPLYW